MKTSLEHLSVKRQEGLRQLVGFLCERIPHLEMVILYGSYARGDYVEFERRHEYGLDTSYSSDYDIMLVVSKVENPAAIGDWLHGIENRFYYEAGCATKISFVTENMKRFMNCVKEACYFYVTVKNEGIMLYDSGNYQLPSHQPLSYAKIYQQTTEYFDEWYKRGNSFLRLAKHAFEFPDYKMASFNLHQASENYLYAVRLVYTLYKPKEHDLRILLHSNKKFSSEMFTVFPCLTKEDERLFNLLRASYIQSRYNKGFKVTAEDILTLIPMVEHLKQVSDRICRQQLLHYRKLATEQDAGYRNRSSAVEVRINSVTG